jgi:iron complex outermembrane receptor protein
LSLYGRVASGYRPAAANTPLQGASPIIETDTLWSYELGAKGYLADGRLSYDLAAWYLNWKNLQARVYVNGAQTGGNANSDVTAYGFEAGMTYSPFNNFSLTASFAYTNSELDDDETSAFGALAGENLPLIPEITAALRATQLFQIGSSVEGRVGLGVRYTDQQDTGFEGGVGGNGAVITPLIANFVVEDRFVTDFNLGFDFGNVDLSFYVTNLFDEYGYNSGTARPMIGFIRATASVIEPRTFGGILRVKF